MNNLLAAKLINPVLGPNLQSKSGSGFFASFIPAAVGMAFLVGALIFFFMMIVGAIRWITSGGDKAAVESARGILTSALIGLVILFALFALVTILENFFGINILTLDIGPLRVE